VSLARDVGIDFPTRFVSSPFAYDPADHAWSSTEAILNLPAMAVVVVITALLVAGIRETARFNNFIVAVKLVVVALFIVCAVPAFSTANWVTPSNPQGAFIPPNAGVGIYGWSGLARGAAVVFFAYIGFDAVSTAAQEAKNPMRDMPIGILGSLIICTVLYVVVGFVLTGIVPLRPVERARSHRGRHRCGRRGLAFAIHQIGYRLRPYLGHPRDAAGTAEDFSRDGA
jgi:APA family basic amino acid/polyamine antiporter